MYQLLLRSYHYRCEHSYCLRIQRAFDGPESPDADPSEKAKLTGNPVPQCCHSENVEPFHSQMLEQTHIAQK